MSMISHRTYFYTTPKQLRSIADRLERDLKTVRLGEDVPSVYFLDDPHSMTTYYLAIDQDKLGKER